VSEREREFTNAEFTRLLRGRAWIIVGAALIMALFFGLYALASLPVYEAQSTLQIGGQGGGTSIVSQLFSIGGSNPQINSEVEILRSRSIAQVVIDKLGLSLNIEDATHGGPLTRAFMFVLADRLQRRLRALRVDSIQYPPENIDQPCFLVFTDDSGGFRVSGPAGDLGSGRKGEPFVSDPISFTVTSMVGPPGTRFVLTPRAPFETMQKYRESLAVATLGGAIRTDLIRVSYRATDPTLSSDVVNAVIAEYERRSLEWKETQGQAQTGEIDQQLAEAQADLQKAEADLEAYKNQHGAISLPDEASRAISDLAQREASRIDVNLQLSVLQDVHSRLATQLNSDDFQLPPTLTQDTVIQQLAARNAELMVDLNDLLLQYTENHPFVIEKRQEITRVRESILETLNATITGLVERRSNLDSVISQLDQRLYSIPGVERQVLELTRARDVADQGYRLLMQRKSESQLVLAGSTVGSRIIDNAVPPERPIAPSIKRSLAFGLGLGFVLGLFLAFILYAFDPHVRRPEDLLSLIGATPLAIVEHGTGEGISRAAGIMALAAMRTGKGMLALAQAGSDTDMSRDYIERIVAELSKSLQPILLVDASVEKRDEGFFGRPASPGLSEIASGGEVSPYRVKDLPILVLPQGSIPSSGHVGSRLVRDRVIELSRGASLTLVHAPGQKSEAAMHGWNVVAGGAILVVAKSTELRNGIVEVIETLESDKVPVLGAILLG
jgi:uncharacterized protein involved in exopolysaccharide biosynthesis